MDHKSQQYNSFRFGGIDEVDGGWIEIGFPFLPTKFVLRRGSRYIPILRALLGIFHNS